MIVTCVCVCVFPAGTYRRILSCTSGQDGLQSHTLYAQTPTPASVVERPARKTGGTMWLDHCVAHVYKQATLTSGQIPWLISIWMLFRISGEPNDNEGEDCGTFKMKYNGWNDFSCNRYTGFICAAPLNTSNALANSEYTIGDVTSDNQYDGTLAGARQRCTDLGYRLAEVTSNKVVDQIKKNPQWNPSEIFWIDGPKQCLNSDSCTGKFPYICEAFHSNGLELSTRQSDYTEAETIKVECTASGLPLPNVTWYKKNGFVPHASGKGAYQESELGKSTLVIENAKLDDTARYRCYAANLINGKSRKTKIYTDIRVHPEIPKRSGNEASLGGSAARSVNSESYSQDDDTVPSAPECANWTVASWMLPTIFGLNIMILLAIGVLVCSKRSTPSKAAGTEFTNYAVYSSNGRIVGQA